MYRAHYSSLSLFITVCDVMLYHMSAPQVLEDDNQREGRYHIEKM